VPLDLPDPEALRLARERGGPPAFRFALQDGTRILGADVKSKIPLLALVLAPSLLAGCAAFRENARPAGKPDAAQGAALTEPDRVIHRGDLVKVVLRRPDATVGSLEEVGKDGMVATPDGARVPADGMTLGAFRRSLDEMYRRVPGNEGLGIEAFVASSPYKVIRYREGGGGEPSAGAKPRPATVYPRAFKAPLTVWEAIRLEGGLPPGVDATKVRVLKRDLIRRTLDCSGKDGAPDGGTPVESGDCLFLVPDGTPLAGIFD
jgi:hypothetical protein